MDDVRLAYDSIVTESPSNNWMLLYYPAGQDDLHWLASGAAGLAEMKSSMSEHGLDNVFVCLYRELQDESRKRRCILINYLPRGLNGVRRARLMVHSRRLSATMPAIQTTLTLDHISNLTSNAIFKALADPESTHIITLNSQSSDGDPVPEDPALQHSAIPLPKSSYPSYSSASDSKASRSHSMFAGLRRKRVKSPPPNEDPFIVDTVVISKDEVPPPPPPKDLDQPITPPRARPLPPIVHPQHAPSSSLDSHRQVRAPSPNRDRSQSLSEFAVVSRHPNRSEEFTVHDHFERIPPPPVAKAVTLPPSSRTSRSNFIVPLPDKWSSSPSVASTSAEARAKIRAQAKADKALEEQKAIEREKNHQAHLRALKERAEEEARIEEQRRKETVEAEIRRATTLRREKEEKERLEEEQKREELRLRREMEKRKRDEEHQKLEAWRREREKEVTQAKRKEEEERKAAVLLRKKQVGEAVDDLKALVKQRDKTTLEEKWYHGEINIQKLNGDTLIWRRRYWKIVGQVMLFYRSAKDDLILQSIDLRNDVKQVKEWDEGYEELKAIPFSFVLEFKDRSKDPCSMYADSQEDKVKIFALMNYLGGL